MYNPQRHRRWASALVEMALEHDGNLDVFRTWLEKWIPLADAAVDEFCAALPRESLDAGTAAKQAAAKFRIDLGL